MPQPSTAEHVENSRGARTALLGALIGALGGFAGSLLLFLQATDAQDDSSRQRAADARRSSYVQLLSTAEAMRSDVLLLNNLVVSKAPKDQLDSTYRSAIQPDLAKFAQAEAAAAILADQRLTEAAKAVGSAINGLLDIMTPLLNGTEIPPGLVPYSPALFSERISNLDQAEGDFIQLARSQVL